MAQPAPARTAPPAPTTFREFLGQFGPGIIVVLTWLGAGDIVDMGVAGSNYGYSLLWVLAIAVFMRFVLVSCIGRYQLCNQHGENVLDGLVRFSPIYAPLLFIGAIGMGHVYESYMTVGTGETLRNMTGVGQTWMWAILCNAIAYVLVIRGSYGPLELMFKLFLALLSISFMGSALWVGFSGAQVLEGLLLFEIPDRQGPFEAMQVAMAMIGAVGGSFMNLVYPYFLEEKGWRGPQYRRVQVYDLALGVVVMIILNIAVWVLGAELLYPDRHISQLDDLPNLLSTVLGPWGRQLFYCGVFAAIFTSVVGHAAGLASLGSHAWIRWRTGVAPSAEQYKIHPMYRGIATWCLVSPLIWTLPGMPDFVTLTLAANSAQVVLLPLIAGGLWRITASAKYIGKDYRNSWWENLTLALLFALAIYGAYQSGGLIFGGMGGH